MLVFVALSMRDAYDNALDRRRHSLYPGHVLELIEATSSSYICRCTFLLFCLILAFFFLIPPPAPRQLTDIEFFQNQKPIKEKVESRRKAETNSKNSGKHKKKEENPEPSHENATAKRNNLAYRRCHALSSMADLQRRIKRAWFPPHRQEDRRVVVVFKIHRNGELSDLRLSKSSGFAPPTNKQWQQ